MGWRNINCPQIHGFNYPVRKKGSIEKNSIIVGVEDINSVKKTLDECDIKTSEIIDYEVVLVFDVFDIDGNKITFAKEV